MSRVWTVARHTMAEALRMKIAVIFIAFLALLVVGLPFAVRGDDTVSGAVQTFLTYALGMTGFLLSLLAIFMSKSLSDELTRRHILITMTKPIPRWQFMAGKWLGIVLLCATLLVFAYGGVYVMVQYLATRAEPESYDARRLAGELLVARHASQLVVPDFTRQAVQEFERRREQGAYAYTADLNERQTKADLAKWIEGRWRTVPALDRRVFEFRNIWCDRSPDARVQIQYKPVCYNYPPDEILRTNWYVGDPNKGTRLYQVPRRDAVQRFHTMSIPADAVAADGSLRVVFENTNPFEGESQFDHMISFESADGMEVLFVVGTFGGNLLRHMGLVLCRLMVLAALGLVAASILSFPVAALVSITVYVLATAREFLGQALGFLPDEGAGGLFVTLFDPLLAALYAVVPNFARYDATSILVDGRNVTLAWVLQAIIHLVFGVTAVLGILGCLLFHRREVSEVSI